jgi:peptidyl-prolyl cis-trans isomerase C
MFGKPSTGWWVLLVAAICAVMSSACSSTDTSPTATGDHLPSSTIPVETTLVLETPSETSWVTDTPFAPSETPPPMAAQVNGEPITLAEYQAELARYRAASGVDLTTEDEETVLAAMIDQVLLAQGAAEAGFVVDAELVQARIDQLDIDTEALSDWMATNGYTEEGFRASLARSVAAAWMRDQVIGAVSGTTEQVHARQILLYNLEEANEVLARLEAGADFATLAAEYEPQTLGDLGWFPRGYLLQAALTEAAFSLELGEYSQVIETPIGFHLLQVIERDPQRPLSPEARRVLQAQALQEWLDSRRAQSEILVLVP